MTTKTYLSDAQRKVLDEAEASLTRTYEEVSARLAAAGLRQRPETESGGIECLRCDCEGYLHGPGLKCKRPGCGHLFTSHDVR